MKLLMGMMVFAWSLTLLANESLLKVESSEGNQGSSIMWRRVSIEEARLLLINHDFSLLASHYGLDASEHDYIASRGSFDTTFSQALVESYARTTPTSTSLLAVQGRRHQNVTTRQSVSSLSKLWTWGMTSSLSYQVDHVDTNSQIPAFNPARTGTWVLGFSQPLLNGAGEETALSTVWQNKEVWKAAENSHKNLEVRRLGALEEIYWSWIFSQESEQVRLRSVARAADDLAYNRSAHEAGTFAKTEVLEAETRHLERQAEYLAAQQQTLDTADNLRLLVGWSVLSGRLTSDETIPLVADLKLATRRQLIERARQNRFDLKAFHHQVKSSKHGLKRAKNEKLPTLDLDLDVQYTGTDPNHGGAFDRALSGNDTTWSASLNFSYPLGNRQAIHNYLSEKYNLRRTEKQLAELEATVELEVQQNIRAVLTQQKVVETRVKALESAQATLEAETHKHRLGRISTLTLAQVQERADEAELSLLQARLDSWLSLVNLRVSLGGFPDQSVEAP